MTREEAIHIINTSDMFWARPTDDESMALALAVEALTECKTGEWIYHPETKNIYGGKCIECSECGEKYVVQYIEDEKFCRNCGSHNGAKMEEQP